MDQEQGSETGERRDTPCVLLSGDDAGQDLAGGIECVTPVTRVS
jgi:hypothetical protein